MGEAPPVGATGWQAFTQEFCQSFTCNIHTTKARQSDEVLCSIAVGSSLSLCVSVALQCIIIRLLFCVLHAVYVCVALFRPQQLHLL